jgi:beta-lactamase regulating signal transducer with metallopeptidase domain
MTMLALPASALFVLSVLIKGAVVLGLTAGAAWGLRRQAAAYRHAVWALGLGVALLLPLAEATVPQWSPMPRAAGPAVTETSVPLQATDAPAFSAPATEEAQPSATQQDAHTQQEAQPAGAPLDGAPSKAPSAGDTASPGKAALAGEMGLADEARSVEETEAGPHAATSGEAHGETEGGLVQTVRTAAATAAGWVEGKRVLRAGLAVWGLGGLAVLGWIVAGRVQVRRWIARSERLNGEAWTDAAQWACDRIGVRQAVTLYRSPDVSAPMTAGVLRPVILLPAAASTWSEARRRTVLLHEVAHIRRKDYLTNLVGQLACAVHWINPLAWRAARQLRAEREQACDDRVLAAGVEAPDYAEHLVDVAREIVHQRRLSGALAMARPSELKGRVQSILSSQTPRGPLSRVQGAALGAVVLTVTLPLMALGPVPGEADRSGRTAVEGTARSGEEEGRTRSKDPAEGLRIEQQRVGQQDLFSILPARPFSASPADPQQADVTNRSTPKGDVPGDALTETSAPSDSKKTTSESISSTETAPSPEASTAPEKNRSAPTSSPAAAAADTTDEDTEAQQRQALQEQAVFAISQLASDQAVPRLTDIARSHPNLAVREKAVYHLSEHETEAVAQTLDELARTDSVQSVQEKAVFALSQFEESLGRPRLIDLARTHPNTEVREDAIYHLGEYESEAAVEALRRFTFEGTPTGLQERAVYALSQTGAERAVPLMIEIARTHPSQEVREKAVYHLGQFDDDPRAVDALMQIVNEQ